METQQTYRLAKDYRIPDDSDDHYFGAEYSQGYVPLGPWSYAHILLELEEVADGAVVTFSVEISDNAEDWYATTIHDLTAAQNKWVQAANLAITADTDATIMGISNPAPYLRVIANNSGNEAADIKQLVLITQT